MNANFAPSLALVLQHEAGFNNDPRDSGGPTNKGVTQAVYDDWRSGEKLPLRSVRFINDYEVGVIYRRRYWDACRCDDLPSGVDYAVFDFAINSGVNRACRYLQRAVGVADDGKIGPVTLAAIGRLDADAIAGTAGLIDQISNLRLDFLKHLSNFDRFGRGWTARVADVRATAKEMAA